MFYRYGCQTLGFPGGGMCAEGLCGPLQPETLQPPQHGPRLQTPGHLSPQRAGGGHRAHRGVQTELRTLAGNGGVLKLYRLGSSGELLNSSGLVYLYAE